MPRFHLNTGSRKFCAGLFSALALSGCMKPEDKVKNVVMPLIEKCKASPERFFEVTLYDKSKRQVFQEACQQPAAEVELTSEWGARVMTGPVEWVAGLDKASGAWTLNEVSWEAFDRVKRMRDASELDAEAMEQVEKGLAKSQQELPSSAWLRLERMQNLLNMRQKTRTFQEARPISIGERGEAYMTELEAWSKQEKRPEVLVEARLKVIAHLQHYRGRQESAVESVGAQDEWLERSIQVSLKEGNKAAAEAAKKELEDKRSRAGQERELLLQRVAEAKRVICEEIGRIALEGVENAELKSQVDGARQAAACDAQPAPAAP